MMKRISFWTRAIELIVAANISLGQFADFIGVPRMTLDSWVYSNRIPDSITVYRMSALFGVSMDYLISGSNKDSAAKRLKELEAKGSAVRIKELAIQVKEETSQIYGY